MVINISSLKVQQVGHTKYPGVNPQPLSRKIMANVKQFQKAGSIHDLPHVITKVYQSREKLAKNQLIDLIQEFPKLSIRKAFNFMRRCFDCMKQNQDGILCLKYYFQQEGAASDF